MAQKPSFNAESVFFNAKICLDKVSICGLSQTDSDFIKQYINDKQLFASKNIFEIAERASHICEKLKYLEIFDKIELFLDRPNSRVADAAAPSSAHHHFETQPVELSFLVKEKKRKLASLKATVGVDSKLGGNLALDFPNASGRADHVQAEYHVDTGKFGGGSFIYRKPLESHPWIQLAAGAYRNDFEHWWSAMEERSAGVFLENHTHSALGKHQTRAEAVWRQNIPYAGERQLAKAAHSLSFEPGPFEPNLLLQERQQQQQTQYGASEEREGAAISVMRVDQQSGRGGQAVTSSPQPFVVPMEIRAQAGHHMKYALRHSFVRDTRTNRVFPESGALVKLNQEVFWSKADCVNVKLDGSAQTAASFFGGAGRRGLASRWPRITLEATTSLGLIQSLTDRTRNTQWSPPPPQAAATTANGSAVNLVDKFFLGGPVSLRGFRTCQVGPRQNGAALGTLAYAQAALHAYSQLPHLAERSSFLANHVRLHSFAQWCTNAPHSHSSQSSLRDIFRLDRLRCSAGLGVIFNLADVARIEANYVLPIKWVRGEDAISGPSRFEFGIGIEYQ